MACSSFFGIFIGILTMMAWSVLIGYISKILPSNYTNTLGSIVLYAGIFGVFILGIVSTFHPDTDNILVDFFISFMMFPITIMSGLEVLFGLEACALGGWSA